MVLKLSILDQSVIGENETTSDALQHTIQLAIKAEELGYHRFWVSEHHGFEKFAGSAPEVLIAHLLAKTNNIRIGSGGVLLQHYSPYKVAEIFNVLSSLAPGRVDLGIGNAPGGIPMSTLALQEEMGENRKQLWEKLIDVRKFMTNNVASYDPFYNVKAVPIPAKPAEIYLLGAGVSSAKLAAELGFSFVYAHFVNGTSASLVETFSLFQQIKERKKNISIKFIPALSVIVADKDEDAKNLIENTKSYKVHFASGESYTLSTKELAEKFGEQGQEQYRIEEQEAAIIYGSKESVRRKLLELQQKFGFDEVIVITPVSDFQARLKSFILLNDAFTEIAIQ